MALELANDRELIRATLMDNHSSGVRPSKFEESASKGSRADPGVRIASTQRTEKIVHVPLRLLPQTLR